MYSNTNAKRHIRLERIRNGQLVRVFLDENCNCIRSVCLELVHNRY